MVVEKPQGLCYCGGATVSGFGVVEEKLSPGLGPLTHFLPCFIIVWWLSNFLTRSGLALIVVMECSNCEVVGEGGGDICQKTRRGKPR